MSTAPLRPALLPASASTVTTLRCAAAHSEDPSPCEGAHAVVRVVDQHGDEATGCVHHAARMYASLVRPRVYPSPGHGGKAIEVYKRAAALAPFAWVNAAA